MRTQVDLTAFEGSLGQGHARGHESLLHRVTSHSMCIKQHILGHRGPLLWLGQKLRSKDISQWNVSCNNRASMIVKKVIK